MLATIPSQPPAGQTKKTRFRFIGEAAAQLGVHRITLWRTLKGHYPDFRGLRRQYRAFLREKRAGR